MKGFLHLGTIFMWFGILSIFGGSFFALTDAGTQCIMGYGCEDIWKAAVKLFLTPQVQMSEAIDTIQQKTDDGTITDIELNAYRKEIIASVIITLMLFLIFSWLCVKGMTTLNGTDYLFAGLGGLVIIAILQMVLGFMMDGQITVPFIGFIKLFNNPSVLIGAINYSEILPLNTTINESYVVNGGT